MSTINVDSKEISLKVVYYGPGLCGKTTTLEAIHGSIPAQNRPKMVAVATEEERTLFCDFLPVHVGRLGPYAVRLQLYTVPGQVFYNSTRKLVLRGADGVVFVADSQTAMRSQNSESFENLQTNLTGWGENLEEVPHVMQYNKRDLAEIQDIDFMNKELNKYGVPFFESVAAEGRGVHEPLYEVTRLMIRSLTGKGMLGKSSEEKKEPAAAAAPTGKRRHHRPGSDAPTPTAVPVISPNEDMPTPVNVAVVRDAEAETEQRKTPDVPPAPPSTPTRKGRDGLPRAASSGGLTESIARASAAESRRRSQSQPPPVAPATPAPAASAEESQAVAKGTSPGTAVPAAGEQRSALEDLSFSSCWEDSSLRSEARIAEDLVRASQFAEAVVKAAQLVNLATQSAGYKSDEEALYILLRGCSGQRFQRFRELVRTALVGGDISKTDALFAIHFVTELALSQPTSASETAPSPPQPTTAKPN